ncbi:hypothetical protein BDV96DRAFT_690195 [Lophiotrema nucula]|uniref:Neprosin PEP catalytic domain-containing protein n=1 Tax=Lophiotrema nucula TaxID=690887 RepID=A0A6A5Z0G8_9PLEO|nr:hypothetical protein BDV96DRAFT_690195 [Lophiotrema nucula]
MAIQRLFLALLSLHGLSTAIPVDGPLPNRNLRTVKRQTLSDGSQIDWVPLDSQTPSGKVASPPPGSLSPKIAIVNSNDPLQPKAELQLPGAEQGPAGTVPVLVADNATLPMQRSKSAPPGSPGAELRKRAVGDHWYASSAQAVNNHGGSASYSIYKAWTESDNDFSLLQVAVTRYNVPKPGDNSQTATQTLEAGWINYPAQIQSPHLFTFFTTDGYQTLADNKGGWNRDVAGWVQVDSQIFPGTAFGPLSVRGGAQYEIKIQYLLYQGNWWLWALDRWIGYYPASLFSNGTPAAGSLADHSDHIHYYGEIYDSHPQLTKTDMGSGNFPEAGFGQAAFMRKLVYTDTNEADQYYDGSGAIIVSDTNRYRMVTQFGNRDDWGSYMYLGGPGAGGQTDA